MSEIKYALQVTAVAEVRDANGNLKDSTPVTIEAVVDEATYRALSAKDD